MGKYYVGIDLGGTNITAGVVDGEYNILAFATTKTNCPRSEEEISKDMAMVANQAVKKAGLTMNDIESIGAGSPGIVNSKDGIVEYSCNLGFSNTPLAKLVSQHTKKDVFIENDANAAAFGEFLAGSAKGVNSAVCITLGTGVGSGIIIDKKIYQGFNFAGGEIGHMVIEKDGVLCGCGRKGCFEAYASATGLIRMTSEAMDNNKQSIMWDMSRNKAVDGRLAFDAMRKGDISAKEVVDKYIDYLACGITNVINIFQPDVVCVGGGVCNEGEALMNPVKEIVGKDVYSRDSKNNTKLVVASLGNNAGIIGAAFLGR